jgi:cobalt-zinc-cadmium efflux system membrane fusion protein
MTRHGALLIALSLTAACARHEPAPAHDATAPQPVAHGRTADGAGLGGATITPASATIAASGTIVLPVGSPMLQQIHRAPAGMQQLPTAEVVAPGKIDANPNRVSKLLLPVSGRITSVLVKMGDSVRKDQPLLTMQSPDADAAMSAYLTAQAALAQARAGLVKAQADDDRSVDLFAHNAVAKKDVLSADSLLAQAKAAVEQAQAARQASARRLTVLGLKSDGFEQQVVVRAPLSGKVLDLSVVPGEFRNDTTQALMTIADLSTVWVTSQVPESYIRFVQPGERLEISLVAYPGETFEGRVSRIADTVDPQTRSVRVEAEMDNRGGRFRPEMFGSIHHIEALSPTLVLPAGAVIQRGDKTVVFVETAPGRFEQRQVSIGPRAGSVVRVLNGVTAGESIVVDGGMLLQGLANGA